MVSSIVCSRVREFHLDFCMTLCLSSLSSSVHHVERYRVSKRFSLLLLCFIITQRRYTNPTKPITIKKHVHNFSCQKKSLLVENIVVEAGGRKSPVQVSVCSCCFGHTDNVCEPDPRQKHVQLVRLDTFSDVQAVQHCGRFHLGQSGS